jgi:hypothetical protein
MATTPHRSPGQDRTRFCAAACDLNHAAVPHAPWDCNAPDGAPTIGQADRRVLAELDPDRLPWVLYATPLVLSAAEVDRLRSPIGRAMHALEVDETDRDLPDAERLSPRLEALELRLLRAKLDAERASTRLDVPARFSCADANQLRQIMDEAAGRLGDLIRRRDAATPGYLVGSKLFGKAAQGLREWSVATLAPAAPAYRPGRVGDHRQPTAHRPRPSPPAGRGRPPPPDHHPGRAAVADRRGWPR